MVIGEKEVLVKAVLNVAEQLKIDQNSLVAILGVDLRLGNNHKLDLISEAGKRALLLVHLFKLLYTVNGGDLQWMQHFMKTHNIYINGVPIKKIEDIAGLIEVCNFLQKICENT